MSDTSSSSYMILPMWRCDTNKENNELTRITIINRLGNKVRINLNSDGSYLIEDPFTE